MSIATKNSQSLKPPLAHRMRPKTLDEYVGQQDIIGEGTPLYKEITSGNLKSIILYGPAGCGKTSLAEVIAGTSEATFESLSAVNASVKDVRGVTERAFVGLQSSKKTILFLDEVHRFNKGQQDVLLPAVESGTVTFIGATTENPFFSINSPLISRSRLYILRPLSAKETVFMLKRALKDKEKGLGSKNLKIADDVLKGIAKASGGDGRRALSLLEMASEQADEGGKVSVDIVKELVRGPVLNYDKKGDAHYDVISAFIKSMRGSSVDAALFWLAKMIESGEDARFIARRMVIFASEDVGNADPHALMVATAAAQAVEFVGLPEARINLSQAVIYLSLAPKSNSAYKAINAACKDAKDFSNAAVPPHLRGSSYYGAKKLGHGVDYKYPHDYPGAKVGQQYLPQELKGKRYYEIIDSGIEKKLAERFVRKKKK
jgi:putative ATPase